MFLREFLLSEGKKGAGPTVTLTGRLASRNRAWIYSKHPDDSGPGLPGVPVSVFIGGSTHPNHLPLGADCEVYSGQRRTNSERTKWRDRDQLRDDQLHCSWGHEFGSAGQRRDRAAFLERPLATHGHRGYRSEWQPADVGALSLSRWSGNQLYDRQHGQRPDGSHFLFCDQRRFRIELDPKLFLRFNQSVDRLSPRTASSRSAHTISPASLSRAPLTPSPRNVVSPAHLPSATPVDEKQWAKAQSLPARRRGSIRKAELESLQGPPANGLAGYGNGGGLRDAMSTKSSTGKNRSGRNRPEVIERDWSGREDSNLRPPGPEPGALPG